MLSADSKYPVPDWLPKRLEGSWQRCQDLGLDRNAATRIEPIEAPEIRRMLERDEQLLNVAAVELQALLPALAGTGHIAFVVDDLGLVVAAAGDMQNAGPILGQIQRGVNLSEAVCGTNAAGTVIVERYPTFVRRSQHYFSELAALDCFAAPIMAPSGQLLGALTISNSTAPQVPGVAELIQIAVARMERSLVRNLESPLLIRMHPHIDGLGSSAEGLVAVGADGEVIGLNPSAARMLGIGAADLNGQSLETVFDTNPLRTMSLACSNATVLRVRGGLGVSAVLTRNAPLKSDSAIWIKPSKIRSRSDTDLRLIEPLSKRELQVLSFLKLGLTNQDIARRLFLSEDSIKYHLKNIFQKLRCKSRLEAVKVARELGLIPEDYPGTPKPQLTS